MAKVNLKYKQTVRLSDFTMAATVVCPAGTFTEIAQLTVPAAQQISWGQSAIIDGVDDRGQLQLDLSTAVPANVTGQVQIGYSDANGVFTPIVDAFRTEQSNAPAVYRIAEKTTRAGFNSRLVIRFNPDATNTITLANSSGLLPLTVYALDRTA